MKYATALLLVASAAWGIDEILFAPPDAIETPVTSAKINTTNRENYIYGDTGPFGTSGDDDDIIQQYLAGDKEWLKEAVKDWDSTMVGNSRPGDTDRFLKGIPLSATGSLVAGQVCRPILIMKIRVKSLNKSVYKLGASSKSGKPVLKKLLLWRKSMQQFNGYLIRTRELDHEAQVHISICYANYARAVALMLERYAQRASFAKPNDPWRCHHYEMLGAVWREYQAVTLKLYGTDQADQQRLLQDRFEEQLPGWWWPHYRDPTLGADIAAWTRDEDTPGQKGKKGSIMAVQKAWGDFRGSEDGTMDSAIVMGQALSDEQPRGRSREDLMLELVQRFQDKCFTSLELYSLQDVFKSLADHQGSIHYVKEDTVARFLEIPDVLAASQVLYQMVSYLGAFPFMQEAPVILELPQLIIVIVIMTERYKRVLAKGSTDRTKLLFNSMAVFDRKLSGTISSPPPKSEEFKSQITGGFAIDEPQDDAAVVDDANDDGDLVLTAFELLDIQDAVKQGHVSDSYGAIIPTDNLRKLIMLLVLVAPLNPQESLSQYRDRVEAYELDTLRAVAESILAAFTDVEESPGITYGQFKTVVPALFPNLFSGFNSLFEHFLFSKNLDLSKKAKQDDKPDKTDPPTAQPLLPYNGEILHGHMLSQISLFLPGSSLFRRVRPLYSGAEAGFSMGSFETKVFNWQAPTILLVSGTRLPDKPEGGQEAAFAESLPPKRFKDGSKGERLTFGVYVRQPWKHTHRQCFGDSETVLFQLEPVHDVFTASTLNTDYVTYTKPPGNQPCIAFGCPHPKPTASNRRDTAFSLGAVSLLIDNSFEYGVFNHNYTSRGGAFHTSSIRKRDFQDRFQIEQLEVWGCGGDKEAQAQAERWAWEAREAEARRRINLGTGDQEADRALLEMAGLVGGNRSGGSMA